MGVPERRHLSEATRERIFDRDGHACVYCDEPATEIDHIVPWTHSHDDSSTNLVSSCRECNAKAGGLVFESLEDKRAYILIARDLIDGYHLKTGRYVRAGRPRAIDLESLTPSARNPQPRTTCRVCTKVHVPGGFLDRWSEEERETVEKLASLLVDGKEISTSELWKQIGVESMARRSRLNEVIKHDPRFMVTGQRGNSSGRTISLV